MADDNDINVNRAYLNAWIVYINGIEVPVSSVSVSYGVWQIPQAEIVMIPDPVIQRLGSNDRISVQVFYCDQWIQPTKPEFRLLFDGEIVAWSYVNVQRGRSISFTAVDYVQIFTQLFFFFMSSVDDLAIAAQNNDIGVNASGVTTPGFGPLWPYSLFADGILPKQDTANPADVVTADVIKKPIDYVYNIVRGLLGDYPNASVPAANFFGPWARRTSFNKRFVALPYLETSTNRGLFPILRAVQADWAVAAVARMTATMSRASDIFSVFREILSTLMMELAMIPTAPAVQIKLDELRILGPATRSETGKVIGLANYFVKPQFLFGIAPSCNVFFPSQIQQFGYQENYAVQPTRMYFNDNSWTSYLNVQNATPALNEVIRAALTVAHPEEVNIALRETLQNPALNGKNVLVYPEEFFRGPVVARREMPRWFLFLKHAQDRDINEEGLSEAERIELARVLLPSEDVSTSLFRVYAAYEYAKERYSSRNAGLSMAFNPYPVPGFPAASFDRRSTQVDVVGYVMSVRHILSSRNMMTDVSMSYARTFQEMFGLIRKQTDAENEDITKKAAEVKNKIKEGKGGLKGLSQNAEMQRLGPIAMGPAEIIPEVRDRIQNFQRAEQFYKALFYAEPSIHDQNASQEQAAEISRLADEPNNPKKAPTKPYDTTDNDILPYLRKKKAAFKYNEIIRITPRELKKKAAADIEMAGIDQLTRITLVGILDKMRTGTASTEDLLFVQESLNLTTLDQQAPNSAPSTATPAGPVTAAEEQLFSDESSPSPPAAQVPDPTIAANINALEEQVLNTQIKTNLQGDVDISPHPNAADLFESYSAAMAYNARPICTLFEYVAFLGDRAFVEGVVNPTTALKTNDERTFPAVYYQRIRKYTPGPVKSVPEKDYMNSTVITASDGVTVVPVKRTGEDTNTAPVEPPRPPLLDLTPPDPNATTTPAATDPEKPLAAETHDAADATQPAKTTTAHVVKGVPEAYAETAQDWDLILLEYRRNVLSRLSPGK